MSGILVFIGCLGSLFICILPAILWNKLIPSGDQDIEPFLAYEMESDFEEIEYYDDDNNVSVIKIKKGHFLTRTEPRRPDRMLELYRNPTYKDFLIDYFTDVCGSHEIAKIILANADEFDIPPALAFSLCWEESKFNPRAINNENRNESIDRGLFQLNNRSFPNLEVLDFYNPDLNARNGLRHLRSCLDIGGNEIIGLSIYNAGVGRVRNTGTPLRTLIYVNRILENRDKIESHFHEWEYFILEDLEGVIHDELKSDAEAPAEEKQESSNLHLIPLIPLVIR
jgi:hypothetical protein